MLGFNAVSEQPIATVAVTVGAAGHMVGVSNLTGHAKFTGIFPSAGHIKGEGFLNGVSFVAGVGLGLRNQLFDFSVDVLSALLWQDDVAPTLTALLQAKQTWYDKNFEEFWQEWFTNVFDLRTANAFGCTVWSIILKMPINVQYPQTDGAEWGFGPYQQNFGRGNFAPETYVVIPLTPLQARTLLQLRYYKLITRCYIPDINKNLARIFAPFGKVWAINNRDMTMSYVWNFDMPEPMQYIIELYDLLPHPAGTSVSYWKNGQAAGSIKGQAFLTGRNNHSAGIMVGSATLAGVGAQF